MATADPTVELIESLDALKARLSSGQDPGARKEALEISKKLSASLADPGNVAVELIFSPLVNVAARIAIGMNLFEYIAGHGSPINSEELAAASGGEELLIIRVLRLLACEGFVKEVGERTWAATPVTAVMAAEPIAAGYRLIGDLVLRAANSAPKFFSERGQRCPTDPRDGPIQFALSTKLSSFELMGTMPGVQKDFDLFMGHTLGANRYWLDWFPVQERILDHATRDSALLVDVGAGKGHDLLAFREKFPHQGRLVLQDQAHVTAAIGNIDPEIEVTSYDFFTEQPVKGARMYFYHHIFHDWPDSECLRILEQVKGAMEPGYSTLLIHDMIIPEQGAKLLHGLLDINLMIAMTGTERTERQWRELFEKAGLRAVQFWLPPDEGADGVIEVMRIDKE